MLGSSVVAQGEGSRICKVGGIGRVGDPPVSRLEKGRINSPAIEEIPQDRGCEQKLCLEQLVMSTSVMGWNKTEP